MAIGTVTDLAQKYPEIYDIKIFEKLTPDEIVDFISEKILGVVSSDLVKILSFKVQDYTPLGNIQQYNSHRINNLTLLQALVYDQHLRNKGQYTEVKSPFAEIYDIEVFEGYDRFWLTPIPIKELECNIELDYDSDEDDYISIVVYGINEVLGGG